MPASQRSLRITDLYRSRLLLLGERVETAARQLWPDITGLDESPWPESMAQVVTRAQVEGVRLSAAYLGAFIRSETGKGHVPSVDSGAYAGRSRDGRPLSEALQSPLIGVKAKLKAGATPEEALDYGLQRAMRMVGFEAVQTSRDALTDTIEADERLEGWERAVAGTCAACMALSGASGPRFEVHPGCQCVPSPKVVSAPNRFPLPSGAALFSALGKAKQDAAVGAEAAEKIRDGEPLEDFVSHSKLETDQPNFITQRPAEALA